jgi:hypothetical protein
MMSTPSHPSRRIFLGSLAAASAPALAAADDPPKPAEQLSAEGEMQFATILARYGDRLTIPQRAIVRRNLKLQLEAVQAVRKFSLTQADEPAPVFRVYRKPEGVQ